MHEPARRPTNMKHLEAQSLDCGYGSRQVLREVSLTAQPGEVLAILGPNGSGKTTLLKALARLLRPRAGSVFWGGQDVWNQSPRELARQIALAPQSESHEWPLSVEEAVLLGRAPHRGWFLPYADEDRAFAEQALVNTGLIPLRQRPITQLSGGELRRMILARALAQEAQALLLDEPMAGLDYKYQLEVLPILKQLAKEQDLLVVLSLHDLNFASLYCDRVAVLSEGQLVALGAPRAVLTEELISRTFGIRVTVVKHPVYETPLIVPLMQDAQGAADC